MNFHKMLRNILRTSRYLARREINTFTTVHPLTYSCLSTLHKCSNHLSDYKSFYRRYSVSITEKPEGQVDAVTFDKICNETLESLCDYFEALVEESPNLKGADVTYGDGVLTVFLGLSYGTYVINRQTPNKQIWLSSPTSGPKRYDLVNKDGGYWIYKHDGVTLHQLLQKEITAIAESKVDFKNCTHSLL